MREMLAIGNGTSLLAIAASKWFEVGQLRHGVANWQGASLDIALEAFQLESHASRRKKRRIKELNHTYLVVSQNNPPAPPLSSEKKT
jgi:hypothetical protein